VDKLPNMDRRRVKSKSPVEACNCPPDPPTA
jgi:hypothetical protein